MDDYTKSFDPYDHYEDFECYIKHNMEYLKATEGYEFYKIDCVLSNLLLNKSLIEDFDEKYKEYADLLSKYEADFTYDCEDSIEGYDDITGKFGRVCRVAFLPKRRMELTPREVQLLHNIVVEAHEYYRREFESLNGYPQQQKFLKESIEECCLFEKKFDDFAVEGEQP